MLRLQRISVMFLVLLTACGWLRAQSVPLDPTKNLPVSATPSHTLLPEEYVWTADDVTVQRPDHGKYPWNRQDLRVEPHMFRAHFQVAVLPKAATFYLAGPREAHVFVNGRKLEDFYLNVDEPIGFHVFHADATSALKLGDNVIAVEAVRGRGIVSGGGPLTTQQLTYGEVLVAKIVPAAFGVDSTALVISDHSWRSSAKAVGGWPQVAFDDSGWKPVESLGPVESDVDLRQWSADAGMYGWPGYMGISPALRTFALSASTVSHVFTGRASFLHLDALTSVSEKGPFVVTNLNSTATDAEAPSLLLDFGREIAGRLLVESASSSTSILSIAYGESEIEALATGMSTGQQGGNYLGTNVLEVPAKGTVRGPKSGFRYVRIRFLRGAPIMSFKFIRAEGIYYPVTYAGSFESSDPLLNRIWETGAYTAHLCMQDGIWDAVKRDRGRWVGDLDVEGRVISTVFGDSVLMQETLRALVPEGSGPVNGIANYSALWVTSLYNLFLHDGDRKFLASEHDALLHILANMDTGLDADGLFMNGKHQWLFVDWSPGLYAMKREATIGTNMQYGLAYREAGQLLMTLGDKANSEKYRIQGEKTLDAVQNRFRDNDALTYGSTWQLNALALRADGNDPEMRKAVWLRVLSHVKQDAPMDQVVSPYFNLTVLDAMAKADHKQEALDWLRTYWGGMLAEGATSFWESYDLRWPKSNPHLSMQADGTSGYFVSMAHGWSSGPTAWLTENVLGITPTSPGYATVDIRPDLLGLEYANGSVPTPHGAIVIHIDRQKGIELDLPSDLQATVVYGGHTRSLSRAGHYAFAPN